MLLCFSHLFFTATSFGTELCDTKVFNLQLLSTFRVVLFTHRSSSVDPKIFYIRK